MQTHLSMEPDSDLFGDPVREPVKTTASGKRKNTVAWGYFAPPGTGPSGETCATCKYLYRKNMAKTYLKCLRSKGKWTGGAKTDVRARSPACSGWEPTPPTPVDD